MTTVEDLTDASDTELKVLCAAVAERGAGFGRTLGSAEQQRWLDAALDLVWSAAAGEAVADECGELLDDLEPADDEGDADEHDPTARPGFFADQALGLAGEALAGVLRPSGERVESAQRTLRTLFSMVDFTLGGERPVIVRSGEQPVPGPLVRREIDAERETRTLLAEARDASAASSTPTAAVNAVRAAAGAFAGEVTPAVEEFAEARNWR